ncbi:MAG: hydroxymethylbilane synthase [Campylobacterota bacterium]
MQKIRIATRASNLALWQAYHIQDMIMQKFPGTEVEIVKITSKGDRVLDKPLALIGGKGHFTKELEDEMLAGNADMAVHSLKDVPTNMPQGLDLIAITKKEDDRDVFLSHKYASIEELPKGAVVGSTSLRRRMQLLKMRPDITVKNLRGNVNTRLAKLERGEYDAIILAYIGMKRLDLLKEVPFSEPIDTTKMLPPMGQAALGIEIVSGNSELEKIALSLNDDKSWFCSNLERDFVRKLAGSCSVPIAVHASIQNEQVRLQAMVGLPDGTNILEEDITKPKSQAQNLGVEVAQTMIDNGALEILKRAEEIAFKDERCERL